MKLITADDLTELRLRLWQRGLRNLLSRLQWSKVQRTRSTFDQAHLQAANWWILPEIRKRWNLKMTGNAEVDMEDYVVDRYLGEATDLTLLSPGCGSGGHELNFARHRRQFREVKGFDVSPVLIREANEKAEKEGMKNAVFEVGNMEEVRPAKDSVDVILFNQSLHHFRNVRQLISTVVYPAIRPGGLLVVHEYVGPLRLQWEHEALARINSLLRDVVPRQYRVRYGSRMVKKSVSGPGWLRMVLSDPSEAVDSTSIIPALRDSFEVLEERPVGGNILMPLLKDIAHHFISPDEDRAALLQQLFEAEDEFLENHPSLIHFGIYKKPLL